MPERAIDIAIIGGGMVGASLACLLPGHFNIMVLESFPLPENNNAEPVYQPSYDARSTALSLSSYDIFSKAGVWQTLRAHVEPILNVHVSDKGYWGSTLLQGHQENLDALGFVVENPWLGRTLLYHMQQKQNITFCCPATVINLRPRGEQVELQVEKDGQQELYTATLAIVADGAESQLCQKLGIHTHVEDYGHTGIVANVTTDKPHQGVAYERFTDTGPMALLPLPVDGHGKNRSALIWTMPSVMAKKLLETDDNSFLVQLQERFGYRQGQFTHIGKRYAYPLKLSTASEQVRQNIIVLGNAAHSLHPVAGQGFNLALRDANMLAALLTRLSSQGSSIGDVAHLMEYEQRQKSDQQLTTAFSDILPDLFSSKNKALALGRGIGLVGLELLPVLKSSFIRFATGIRHIA